MKNLLLIFRKTIGKIFMFEETLVCYSENINMRTNVILYRGKTFLTLGIFSKDGGLLLKF